MRENIEVKDVVKFFVQYMKNDQLGMIANAHLGNFLSSFVSFERMQIIMLKA